MQEQEPKQKFFFINKKLFFLPYFELEDSSIYRVLLLDRVLYWSYLGLPYAGAKPECRLWRVGAL